MSLEQVTDSVSQVNTQVIGLIPASASANLMNTISQALALASLNAVAGQQQGSMMRQASTVQGANGLFSTGHAVTGAVAEDIIGK